MALFGELIQSFFQHICKGLYYHSYARDAASVRSYNDHMKKMLDAEEPM